MLVRVKRTVTGRSAPAGMTVPFGMVVVRVKAELPVRLTDRMVRLTLPVFATATDISFVSPVATSTKSRDWGVTLHTRRSGRAREGDREVCTIGRNGKGCGFRTHGGWGECYPNRTGSACRQRITRARIRSFRELRCIGPCNRRCLHSDDAGARIGHGKDLCCGRAERDRMIVIAYRAHANSPFRSGSAERHGEVRAVGGIRRDVEGCALGAGRGGRKPDRDRAGSARRQRVPQSTYRCR